MNESIPQAQEKISVFSYMDQIEENIDRLRKTLSELEAILDPYMIPANSVESKSLEDPPASVFLKRLKALNKRTGEIIADVGDVIRRLQL